MREVHVYVFDTLADWEIGHTLAHLHTPQFQRTPRAFEVRLVANSLAPVVTMGGLRLQPDLTLSELEDTALLILPGGLTWDRAPELHRDVLAVAEALLARDVPVAAICGATGGLARAGLLAGRKHTSNAREYLAATEYSDGALYCDEPAVTDGPLITAGSTAVVEFAAHVFAKLELFEPAVLEAWRGLFETGEARYFGALMAALE